MNGTAFAVVAAIVTAGTIQVFGKAITDPAEMIAKVPNPVVLVVGALLFATATIGVNIVANFVSPAYDLANVLPSRINFQRGGMISAVVAVLVLPWNLYSNPAVVNYFLGGLGAILGPLFGIMMVDYYLVRRRRVVIEDLFRDESSGAYYYRRGVNPRALYVFVPTALIACVVALLPSFALAAPFSWFVGAGLGAVAYYFAMRGHPSLAIEGVEDVRRSPDSPLEDPKGNGKHDYGKAGEARDKGTP